MPDTVISPGPASFATSLASRKSLSLAQVNDPVGNGDRDQQVSNFCAAYLDRLDSHAANGRELF